MILLRSLKKFYRRTDKGMFFLTILFLILTPIFLTPWLSGHDRVGYYALPRSLIIDHDINLKDETEYFIRSNLEKSNSKIESLLYDNQTNKYYTVFPIGTELVWTPFFFTGHIMTILSGGITDGYSEIYLWWVSFGSALFGFIGILLIFKILRDYFSEFISTLSVIGIWFSTNLFYYMFFEPIMSHSISMAFTTIFVYYWYKTLRRRKTINWFILGIIGGLMFIIRFQNAIFFLLPLFDVVPLYLASFKRHKIKFPKELFVDNLIFLLGIFLGYLPQMFYFDYAHNYLFTFWKHYNGDQLSIIRGLGNLHNVLFSSNHGLISWTPILFLSLIGIFLFIKYQNNKLGAKLSVIFLLQLLVVASFTQWSAGQSYGHRMFVLFSLFFALGLASLLENLLIWLKSRDINYKLVLILLVLVFIAWNFGLMVQYGTRMISTESAVPIKEIAYNNFFVIPEKLLSIVNNFLFNRSVFIS